MEQTSLSRERWWCIECLLRDVARRGGGLDRFGLLLTVVRLLESMDVSATHVYVCFLSVFSPVSSVNEFSR